MNWQDPGTGRIMELAELWNWQDSVTSNSESWTMNHGPAKFRRLIPHSDLSQVWSLHSLVSKQSSLRTVCSLRSLVSAQS